MRARLHFCSAALIAAFLFWAVGGHPPNGRADELPYADGFRGCWYMNQPSKDQYHYKYSGGMATYPQQHVPIAIHRPEAKKTFFVFGGNVGDGRSLHHLIAYFDHATGLAGRPRVLLDKMTADAHDNPTLQIDDAGHLWVFSASHGTARPSFIHRSLRPYAIDSFEKVMTTNFSYPQPWHMPGKGFLFLHTRYRPKSEKRAGGRWLFSMHSANGRSWDEPTPLAFIEMGDYQVSWRRGDKIGTAFDCHPRPGGLNARTNLYYLETTDFGGVWRSARGDIVDVPVTSIRNDALVRDYRAERKLVYLKDIAFDDALHPIIVYLTSDGYASGPASGKRTWHTARWTGSDWEIRPICESDHNYDHGSFWIEPRGVWRLIAPTEPGPQPYGTGGEMALWQSDDEGLHWRKVRQLTNASRFNHTYARKPVDAHPDFAVIWADGNAFAPSESSLYFANRDGTRVWRLPRNMSRAEEKPELVD